jgi:hypothetical protein
LGAPDQGAKVKAQLGRSAELEEINTNTTTIKHMVNFLNLHAMALILKTTFLMMHYR